MGRTRRFLAKPIKSLASGSIVAGYTKIGTPFSDQIRVVYITNLTDAALMFSFTGNTNHIVLPAQGFILLDITANKVDSGGLFLPENTQMYVKQVAVPTTGSVYISSFYSG